MYSAFQHHPQRPLQSWISPVFNVLRFLNILGAFTGCVGVAAPGFDGFQGLLAELRWARLGRAGTGRARFDLWTRPLGSAR